MMHGWIRSGELVSPREYAEQDYVQYPGFSLPFHPPGYPGAMALFFFVTGVNYAGARIFVALCAGVAASAFYGIARRGGAAPFIAFLSAVLLITTPEFAKWSRDTMSEIPATAAMLVASLVFFVWCERNRPWLCWAAFFLASFAFLCRVTTVGIMPAWLGFLVVGYGMRRVRSVQFLVPLTLYIAFVITWVKFVGQVSTFGVAADAHRSWGSVEALSHGVHYFLRRADLFTWGTTYVAIAGVMAVFLSRRTSRAFLFFANCLLAYIVFKLVMPTTDELRHVFGIVPGLAGVSLGVAASMPRKRSVVAVFMLAGVSLNLLGCGHIPGGVVGYEGVARRLAELQPTGNILMCCWDDQELIFRYRSASQGSDVQMLRGDRVLAIRVPGFAKRESVLLATDCDDFLDVVRRGRVRFLVTCHPPDGTPDRRFPEMKLAHQCAVSHTGRFELIGTWTLDRKYYVTGPESEIFVWRVLGQLEPGPSELPVRIPTAGTTLHRSDERDSRVRDAFPVHGKSL